MKVIFKTILFCALLASSFSALAKEWRGIIPLHSSRADVERLLGPPTIDRTDRVYYTLADEEVRIEYSRGSCKANRGGWNAPHNTVISIWVDQKRKPKFADIKLDLSKYRKKVDDHSEDIFYYVNEEEGISYEVNAGDGVLTGTRYFPSNNSRRCPESDDDLYRTVKVDEYSNLPFYVEKKRLDAFAQKLFRFSSTYGYIMVYAGRRARTGEAQAWGKRAKEYLVEGWGLNASRVVFIDGGNREKFTVELYLVPAGATPPASKPTIHPDDVQIIKP